MARRRHIIAVAAFAAAAVFAAGFSRFAAIVAEYRPVTTGDADGIVALTGGEQRIAEAVRLLSTKAAKRLLISGANPVTTKEHLLHMLQVRGAAAFACCIDMGYAAEDTSGNAMEARGWAARNGYASLIIVTSNYHMPRSLLEFERAMPGMRLVPHAVAHQNVRAEAWWAYPRTALTLGKEYVKFIRATVLAKLSGPLPPLPKSTVGPPSSSAPASQGASAALQGAAR